MVINMSKVKRNTNITQERVRELFDYNPETGVLTRRINIHSGRGSEYGSGKIQCRAGDIAGKINRSTGYLDCRADGPIYRVHRLIWLWWYGYFPEHDIDHINRDKTDNRLYNLREVSRSCNLRNRPNLSNNTSTVCGVSFDNTHNTWKAGITVLGVRRRLGSSINFTSTVALRFCAEYLLEWDVCYSESSAARYLVDSGVIEGTAASSLEPLAEYMSRVRSILDKPQLGRRGKRGPYGKELPSLQKRFDVDVTCPSQYI